MFHYRLRTWFRESLPRWFADHLPRSLVYFCVIRLWATGTTGKWGETDVTKLTISEALRRWEGA